MTKKNSDLEDIILNLKEQETNMQSDLDKLKNLMTEDRNQIVKLNEDLKNMTDQFNNLEKDLKEARDSRNKLEQETGDQDIKSQELIKDLQGKITEKESELTDCKTDRDELKNRITKAQSRLNVNQQRFKEEITNLQSLGDQIDSFKSKVSNVVGNIGLPLTKAFEFFSVKAQEKPLGVNNTNITANISNKANNTSNKANNTSNKSNNTSNKTNNASNKSNNTLNQSNNTLNQANNASNKSNNTSNKDNNTSNKSNNTSNKDNNTSNKDNTSNTQEGGGKKQIVYKMFGGGKKYNLKWRYVSHRTTFGGYNRKSLERLATKWGIQNAKSYKRRDLLQKTMHFIMFARHGDVRSRKNLNIAAKMIGVNPRKYKKKQDLYRAIYNKTNKMSFSLRGGKKVVRKTRKTKKN